MSTVVSPRLARMLASAPPYYSTDSTIPRLLQVVANELDRVEAALDDVQNGLVPLLADDTFGMLGLWEHVLGLPVAPVGVSLAQRQGAVKAALLARNCRTTDQWWAALSTVIGGSGFTVQFGVPAAGEVTIRTPLSPGSYLDGVTRTLARRLTPANYEIVWEFTGGFIVGVSDVGDAI